MNKFAEIRYGKVAHIYDTTRTLEEMKKIFVPATLLVDVTGIKCGIGWRVDYENGLDAPNFIAPKVILPPTIEEEKQRKISELKKQRDTLEVSPIEWNGNSFDYDDKARARLAIARQAIEDGLIDSLVWTTADHENVTVTLDDFKGINANASIRSNLLHVAYRTAKQAVLDAEKIETVQTVKLEA